jgi:hypothetical protein
VVDSFRDANLNAQLEAVVVTGGHDITTGEDRAWHIPKKELCCSMAFIDKEALAQFKKAKIEDPAAHFRGKTVQVTGKVTLYHDHPEITLTGPDAIKVVQKK